MITKEQIGYELEIEENVSVDDIRKAHPTDFLIWLSGSGQSPNGNRASYRYLVEMGKNVKFVKGEVSDATANQAFIYGIIDAVSRLTKPMRVFAISPTTLGFERAFKGKGVNCGLLQQLFEILAEKQCTITEVRFESGAEAIKIHIYNNSGDAKLIQEKKEQDSRQKEYKYNYKATVYQECLSKVSSVLATHGISEEIINEVMQIQSEQMQ